LNNLWGRRGKVFAGRFHERVLKSLRQVRNALRYVLNNHHKHNQAARADRPDPFSTGAYFNGWSDYERVRDPAEAGSYVWPPGWKLGAPSLGHIDLPVQDLAQSLPLYQVLTANRSVSVRQVAHERHADVRELVGARDLDGVLDADLLAELA
jgi:hypothetical protein